MRKRDLDKFRKLLQSQRELLLENARRALAGDIHLDPDDFPDEMDAASSEINLAFLGRLRERERHLSSKIDEALAKIENNEFGLCENCGEEIGIKRLEARPVAELCIDCKSDEIEAPGYRAADEAVIAACRAGNFHFAGVGLSEADRAFLRGRLGARTAK